MYPINLAVMQSVVATTLVNRRRASLWAAPQTVAVQSPATPPAPRREGESPREYLKRTFRS